MNTERMKEMIRRCLDIRDSGSATESEIEQAIRVASAELARMKMTEEEFRASQEKEFDPQDLNYGRTYTYSRGTLCAMWEKQLAFLICDMVGSVQWFRETGVVRSVLKHGRRAKETCTRLHFYGPADDIQWANELYEQIREEVANMAIIKHGSGLQVGNAASYCEGFIVGLRRIHVRERQRLTESVGTALVLVQERDNQITEYARDWLAESEGVQLRTGGGSTGVAHRNESAFDEGREDAKHFGMPERRAGYLE